MIKRYIKQTWEFLKQNKLFGTLYIIGTAVPVVLTMIVITFQYIRVGSIYPEENRDELWVSERVGSQSIMFSRISLHIIKDWFYPLREYGTVTAMSDPGYVFIQLSDGQSLGQVKNMAIDNEFFKVFDFDFVAGKPFGKSDFQSGKFCAVISASLARQLFGKETEAVGKTIKMNFSDYVVTGVVRDASSLTPRVYAQVYYPYTTIKQEIYFPEPKSLMGPYKVCIRASEENAQKMQKIIKDKTRKLKIELDDEMAFVDIPNKIWRSNICLNYGGDDDRVNKSLRVWLGLIIVFLIVPALNLSGMIAGRMEGRLPEMGICKAFGATRWYLLRQVLNENLILTLIGGFIGLLISWGLMVFGNHWIFDFFSPGFYLFAQKTGDVLITGEMLFSPWIFLSAFLVCAVLNLVSALIPVWNALRAEIIYSLNQKK